MDTIEREWEVVLLRIIFRGHLSCVIARRDRKRSFIYSAHLPSAGEGHIVLVAACGITLWSQ